MPCGSDFADSERSDNRSAVGSNLTDEGEQALFSEWQVGGTDKLDDADTRVASCPDHLRVRRARRRKKFDRSRDVFVADIAEDTTSEDQVRRDHAVVDERLAGIARYDLEAGQPCALGCGASRVREIRFELDDATKKISSTGVASGKVDQIPRVLLRQTLFLQPVRGA
jgi:hypothetical protein